jgi:hypothetical protein
VSLVKIESFRLNYRVLAHARWNHTCYIVRSSLWASGVPTSKWREGDVAVTKINVFICSIHKMFRPVRAVIR